MLDLRIYRAAFVPAVLALVVVAFSLAPRPRPIPTTLSPEAFDGERAAQLLDQLAVRYPDRRPGSAGDAALADRVERAFRRSVGFRVSTRDVEADTIDGRRTLRTVIAQRTGTTGSQVVVLAHRDADSAHPPAKAELSATAALIELSRVLSGRATERTLTLVSTSGGSGGAAGAADVAAHLEGPVDGVIVLGDLAATHSRKPWVVGWSGARGMAPQQLQRTVELAVRTEAGAPGGVSPAEQLLRLAFPLTVGEQGPIGAHGAPAVLVGPGGELGAAAGDATSPQRMDAFGRAVLRSMTALDHGPEVQPATPQSGIVVHDQVVPAWAVRLLVGLLLLPPLLAALDGLFRVRRRGERPGRWVGWVLAGGAPFLLAALVLLALGATGLVDAPGAPVPPGAEPVAWAALAAGAAALVLGWAVVRPVLLGRVRPAGEGGGAAAAVGLVTVLAAVAVWARNPFAALFLLPAAHLWLLACGAREAGRGRRLVAVVAGLVPFALAALGYALVLGAGPVALAWLLALLVAGGSVGPLGLILWSVVAGCAASALLVVARAAPPAQDTPRGPLRSRGPLTYAGPGSLGGTDSALGRRR